MADYDFKTAAAKLLAQHSLTAEKPVPKPLVNQKDPVVPPPGIRPIHKVQPELQQNRPETEQEPVVEPIWDDPVEKATTDFSYTDKPKLSQNKLKVFVMVGLIVFFSAIMVFLVPPTRLGILGNILLGVLAGGGFGYIINREL
ncbi:MAG: hypothetical protein H6Q65_1200 [Firmicutes bacterium]|nr:hypothetical protein [Bacillota bacterium]